MPFAAKTKLSENERLTVIALVEAHKVDALLAWLDELVARKRQNEIARRWKQEAYKKGRCYCSRPGCKRCAKRLKKARAR